MGEIHSLFMDVTFGRNVRKYEVEGILFTNLLEKLLDGSLADIH